MGTRVYLGVGKIVNNQPQLEQAIYIHWGSLGDVVNAVYELMRGINGRQKYNSFLDIFDILISKHTYYSSIVNWNGDPGNCQDSQSFGADCNAAYKKGKSILDFCQQSGKLLYINGADRTPINVYSIDSDTDIELIYIYDKDTPNRLHVYEVFLEERRIGNKTSYKPVLLPHLVVLL